jgi:hypothetical protein
MLMNILDCQRIVLTVDFFKLLMRKYNICTLINSASFDTCNDKNNVNEARNENVDKLRQVGGDSVNQPSDKNIPDVYQI